MLINTATGAGLCGGSVISTNAALTAAHCTSASGSLVNFMIIAGAYNRLLIEDNQQRRTVQPSDFVPHPNYNAVFLWNDIAVLRVNPAFTFNQFVQPIILASDTTEAHAGAIVTVSGMNIL